MAHRTTKNWKWTRAGAEAIAASMGAATPTFTMDAKKLHLAKAIGQDEGFGQVIGDFTESDFDGYAAATLDASGGIAPTLEGPLNLSGSAIGLVATVNWACTADQDPAQDIAAVYMTDGASTVALGYEVFADPPGVVSEGDYLQYDLAVPVNESNPVTVT